MVVTMVGAMVVAMVVAMVGAMVVAKVDAMVEALVGAMVVTMVGSFVVAMVGTMVGTMVGAMVGIIVATHPWNRVNYTTWRVSLAVGRTGRHQPEAWRARSLSRASWELYELRMFDELSPQQYPAIRGLQTGLREAQVQTKHLVLPKCSMVLDLFPPWPPCGQARKKSSPILWMILAR